MRRAVALPVAVGLAAAASGCDLEVINPGNIRDADVTEVDLMPVLANGVSAEFNDIMEMVAFDAARLSDEAAGTGSYSETQVFRQGILDWEDTDDDWEEGHEAAWSAEQAWFRFQEVLQGAETSSADAAKLFLLMGHAYRLMGETFCHSVFDIGVGGDRMLFFDSAIAAFDQAITIGTAAGGGVLVGAAEGDLADSVVTSATAGTASAYADMGDFATAVTWANQVPTPFIDQARYHQNANVNVIWTESWNRAEIGAYNTLGARLADDGDPRTDYTKCGEWNTPANPVLGQVTATGNCTGQGSGAHQGADGLHAHYRQNKYGERGSDITRASGAEARLIEAEAFLLASDFPSFNAKITELRAFYGLGAHPHQATAAGALDFPYANPADDAWSVLDEERYASLYLEGKRLFDLDRWEHPFLNGGSIVSGAAQNPRDSCYPVPRIECQLNPNLAGDATVCTG
jgi:hypothetical protein